MRAVATRVVLPSSTFSRPRVVGLLFHTRDGRMINLLARSLVGRASSCTIVLEDRRVSAEHAVISWDGRQWEVRDLASSNGTWVDGRRLSSGERVALRRDTRLDFGRSDESWILVDETIDLPDPLADLPGTLQTGGGPATIDGLSLCFTVSPDEEHVKVLARTERGEPALLPARSCHYTLLTLARARLEDAERGVVEEEQGWLYASDLADMLGYASDRLNVEIYRARTLLAKLGVQDAQRLIERRASSRQLRIGVARLSVKRLHMQPAQAVAK